MATLQVKSLPDDLHARLRARAREEGTTVSALVTRLLRRELARPSIATWLEELSRQPPVEHPFDSVALLDEIRGPWPADAGR